jgi:hypothetical protein
VVVIARCKPSIKVNELRTTWANLSKMPPRGTNLRPTALLAANLQPCIGLQEIDIAAAL